MGCLCSMKKTMNDAADQSSDTPSSSSSSPPPPPPQPPQWNSPPTLLIPPQPHPPPLQSSPAEQMPSRPPPTPLLIPTVRSASPRRAPIYRGSVISRRVLIEQRGRPPPSPHRVPIERRASPPPSSRRVPTERRSSPLPSAHHVLSERRGRPLPSPLRVPIERIANPPPSSRDVPTKRSTSLLSSPRRVPMERNTSPPPGTSSLFEPSFKGPSVAASSSSVPSAEMKKHSQNFTFHDLAIATENFSNANFLGEGGFGNVYKGKLNSGEVVAVKVLRKMGVQGNKEFLTEVLMLTMLKHPNLVGLVGFCSEGDQRLLVYEFMPNGTLLDHLSNLPPNREPLDWNTRIKIIVGVANGLHYLHDLADPPIIYRDMKAENILLDGDFNPKLSDFGLTKLAPAGDGEAYVFTRILENQGYCDPEYVATGKLSKKSDVYSFGILMLELISGRRVYDETAPRLLAWASAFLSDRRLYVQLVDPLLQGRFRRRSLNILAPVIGFCTNREPCLRPPIKDVVKAVADAASFSYDSQPFTPSTASPQSSASL